MTSVDTKCVHAGVQPEPVTGAVFPPIFQVSTFVQESPGRHQGFDYSRADNPTRQALEKALAELESCRFALAFSSGLAAEQAIIQALPGPGKILVSDDVYGGTGRLFRELFVKYGFEFEFIDMADLDELQRHLTADIAMIWVETPSNPLLKIADIAGIAEKKPANCLLVVDNTFASPVFQQPVGLGADIIIHSTTKYIGGHSDLIGGAVMTDNPDLFDKIKFVQFAAGAVPSPIECFLLLRSIKTLSIRMQRHFENASVIAERLVKSGAVNRVFYPGLEAHPSHQVAARQMSGFSGMVSFELKGGFEDVKTFLSGLEIFQLAESLGGVESLVNHPEQMTHASVPEPLRRKLGINSQLIRLSVGIEDVQDLWGALDSAFARLGHVSHDAVE